MKIEFDEQCQVCKGTGLYIGMGERDGAAVVCHKCKGTGRFYFIHTYEEFIGRMPSDKAKWVVQVNPGICIGPKNQFGGMSYQDWRSGRPFVDGMEMREYTCPCWWYQSADYNRKPNWKECDGFSGFSKCPSFCKKAQCWARWDKEFGQC